MTKVLSIDLDYIMGPTIETYQHKVDGPNPSSGWANFYDNTDFKENQFFIDQGNLIYCYNTFLKALSESDNPKVLFGYDHDAILYLMSAFSRNRPWSPSPSLVGSLALQLR